MDGEPDFADTAATFLDREHGRFVVGVATGAKEALASLSETDVDRIVSGYDMPGHERRRRCTSGVPLGASVRCSLAAPFAAEA